MSISYRASKAPQKLREIMIIFLSISLNMCVGCSKAASHRDGSFEYPQHMFWLRNNFHLYTLIWGPVSSQTHFMTISNMNISETSWPIIIKFHQEHHWGGRLTALGFG